MHEAMTSKVALKMLLPWVLYPLDPCEARPKQKTKTKTKTKTEEEKT